ncbi:replication initiation factor domain-containing protein [Agathobaculum sp. LCP25S3_E8]|uniref:replication initiation factor domain-containing protein n=1 Tax=Agathobaculum sp. LCP25S3_E8 TaxID=3438735 RepID=UPI003F90EB2F
MDIAIDDRAGFLDIPKFVEKCDRGECVTRFRRYEIHKSSVVALRFVCTILMLSPFSSEIVANE